MTIGRPLIAVLLAAASPDRAHAETLGRLFHSAAERSALDALRKEKSRPPKPAPQSSAAPQAQRFDGYVLRSDGRSTLWVNGSTVADKR